MNNKEFISVLANKTNKRPADTQKMADALIAVMSDCFQEGDSVQMANFGNFEVKKKLPLSIGKQNSPPEGRKKTKSRKEGLNKLWVRFI